MECFSIWASWQYNLRLKHEVTPFAWNIFASHTTKATIIAKPTHYISRLRVCFQLSEEASGYWWQLMNTMQYEGDCIMCWKVTRIHPSSYLLSRSNINLDWCSMYPVTFPCSSSLSLQSPVLALTPFKPFSQIFPPISTTSRLFTFVLTYRPSNPQILFNFVVHSL